MKVLVVVVVVALLNFLGVFSTAPPAPEPTTEPPTVDAGSNRGNGGRGTETPTVPRPTDLTDGSENE